MDKPAPLPASAPLPEGAVEAMARIFPADQAEAKARFYCQPQMMSAILSLFQQDAPVKDAAAKPKSGGQA